MRTKLIFIALLLASCSGLKPYKMDIHQGNFVTAEMRDKLKLGMSKQQVRYVLGTPMISDIFHGNRWDYLYRFEHGGKVIEKQRLTLDFEGDKLQRIDDDQLASNLLKDGVVPVLNQIEPPPAVTLQSIAGESAGIASQADHAADVNRAVQAWAAAWSSRDVGQYFASYADSFKPKGMIKSVWQAQRKKRISKPSSITVTLSDLNIKLHDDSHASASFIQHYRADSHQDSTQKILQMEKVGDSWLIISERAVK